MAGDENAAAAAASDDSAGKDSASKDDDPTNGVVLETSAIDPQDSKKSPKQKCSKLSIDPDESKLSIDQDVPGTKASIDPDQSVPVTRSMIARLGNKKRDSQNREGKPQRSSILANFGMSTSLKKHLSLNNSAFQLHPGMTFEAIDENGTLLPLASDFVLHYRFFLQVLLFALPFAISMVLATLFVPPGYRNCNLGQENCELEYTLSTVVLAFVTHGVVAGTTMGNPNKFMSRKSWLFWHLRFVWIFTVLTIIISFWTDHDQDLILLHVVIIRIGVCVCTVPYAESARNFLDYPDALDSRKIFSTTEEKGGLKNLLKTTFFTLSMIAPCLALTAFSAIDGGYIATGEFGSLLKDLRPILFIIVKKTAYTINIWAMNNLEEPVGNAAYLRQYSIWWIHLQIAMANCLAAANCESWTAFFLFWAVDLVAFVGRVFVFAEDNSGMSRSVSRFVLCCGILGNSSSVEKKDFSASALPSSGGSSALPNSADGSNQNTDSHNTPAPVTATSPGVTTPGTTTPGLSRSAKKSARKTVTAVTTNLAVSQEKNLTRAKKTARQGKPTAVGEMKFKELLGWDLIIEGVALQVAYMAVIMVYL